MTVAGKKRKRPREPITVDIHAFSHEGRGIAHAGERTLFVDGALPGERVRARVVKRHRRRDEALTIEVLAEADERITPRCPHFGVCGGCSQQHLESARQIAHKENVLREHLEHIGQVAPAHWLEPLHGPRWGYRRKARLGAKYVPGKGDRVLVGFREKHSPYIADTRECHVLAPPVGGLLPALAELIRGLSIADRVPQIEVALGDAGGGLVFRNLAPFTAGDEAALCAFGERTNLWVYAQPGNEHTVRALRDDTPPLSYGLPGHGVEILFHPCDFIQVNAELNRLLVDRVVDLLALDGNETVLDLYCGLGNLTLPVARHARFVAGVEGDAGLVARAEGNARHNGIDNAAFHGIDLGDGTAALPRLESGCDRVVLDPPRTGAAEVLPALAQLAPQRVVYVSCAPATLARDAGALVHRHGYRLASAGVMDMFPHTAHVESIAVFDRR